MKSFFAALLLLATSVLAQTPSQKRPFTFEDMMKLKRLGAPVPSPDGKWVVLDCVDVDLEANTRISHLWVVPASGGESRRLNPTPNHEERPRFSPDGKRLIWTSKATDPTQIWMCDFDSGSGVIIGKPHQVTEISTGADGGIWSPDGKNVVFVSAVYPDCKDDACNKQRDEELSKSENLFAIVLSALERVHRIQAQPSVCAECRGARAGRGKWDCGRHGRHYTKRSYTRRSRCAALLVRWPGHVCDFARWPGGRLHEQHRRSRSNEHKQRNFRRAV